MLSSVPHSENLVVSKTAKCPGLMDLIFQYRVKENKNGNINICVSGGVSVMK